MALGYNDIVFILNFYFFAQSKEDPSDVARQYMEVAGLPAEVPYWSFGFISVGLGISEYICCFPCKL
jgi:alpha-glucosidase